MQHALTTEDKIIIGGRDLATDLMKNLDFVEMWIFLHTGRICSSGEKRILNMLMVSLMDHGVTPTTIAARMTILSAPESIQGAVAAGLLGAGDRFLGVTQNVVEMLNLVELGKHNINQEMIAQKAKTIVDTRKKIPGIGHNIHTSEDPRVSVVREMCIDAKLPGGGWHLLDEIARQVSLKKDREFVINNAGAVGVAVHAMGFEPEFARGLSVVARAAGLVVHAIDEKQRVTAKDLWNRLVMEQNINEQSEDGGE